MSTAAAGLARPRSSATRGRAALTGAAPAFIGLATGAILWEVVGRIWAISFFPPLSAVLVRLGELIAQGKIAQNLVDSLVELAIGFTIAVTAGVTLGMLMGAYRRVEMAMDVYVYAMLTAPSLVFAPIFFAIFGVSQPRLTVIMIVVIYSIWIIVVNTASAIRQVPIALVEMGRSYCASERQLFFKIIIPAAMPLIFAGLRLGIGRAVKGTINGEMFIIAIGLGGVARNAGARFDAAGVFAVLIVIVALALVVAKVVQLIDLRMTSWLPSTARQGRTRRV